MKVEFVVNDAVTLVLCPETEMEIQILKSFLKQTNEIIEVRGTASIMSKSIRGSIVICKRDSVKELLQSEESSATKEKSKSLAQ